MKVSVYDAYICSNRPPRLGLPISTHFMPSAHYWLQARGQITLDLKNTHNRFSPLVRGCQFYLFLAPNANFAENKALLK